MKANLEKSEAVAGATVETQKSLTQVLDEIEDRANKATSGPWRFKRHWGPYNWQGAILHDVKGAYNLTLLPLETCTTEKDADGTFIASARTDVPALVKALRELWDKYTDAVGRGTTEDYYRATVNDESANLAAILNQGRTENAVEERE